MVELITMKLYLLLMKTYLYRHFFCLKSFVCFNNNNNNWGFTCIDKDEN